MRFSSWPILLILTVSLSAPFASAQPFQGPAAAALGGAGRATMDPLESFFLNPASLGFSPPYLHVGGHYQSGEHPTEGENRVWGVVLSDGTPDKIMPGALSYIRDRRQTPAGSESVDQEFRGSAGRIVYPGVGLGVGASLPETELNGGGPTHFQTNADIGALWAPFEMIALGFSAQNVFPSGRAAPFGIRNVPTLGLGFHASYEKMFNARLDVSRPDQFNPRRRLDVGAGFESVFESGLAMRIGCHWRETVDKTLVGAGLSYRGPRLQVDYTLQKDTRLDRAIRHLVDLWIPF